MVWIFVLNDVGEFMINYYVWWIEMFGDFVVDVLYDDWWVIEVLCDYCCEVVFGVCVEVLLVVVGFFWELLVVCKFVDYE